MKLDLEKAFLFVFKDPSCVNKLIAGAGITISIYLVFFMPILVYIFSSSAKITIFSIFLSFIASLILSCLISGFVAETVNKRINYRHSLLPDWSDFRRLVVSGLKYFIGYFLYSIPILILMIVFLILLTFYLGQGNNAETMFVPFGFLGLVLLGTIFLFAMILYSVFCPLMMANFYKDLKILSFVDFKSAIAMLKGNGTNYFVMILIFIALSFLMQSIFTILFVTVIGSILIPLIYFYFYLVIAEVVAQFVVIARSE